MTAFLNHNHNLNLCLMAKGIKSKIMITMKRLAVSAP